MKISKDTIKLITNFSTINVSLWQEPGSVMKAFSPNGNLFAVANVPENFPTAFGIYDLNQFLGITSLFDDPDFDFSEKQVTIRDASGSLRYVYADKQAIKSAWNDKELVMPQIDTSFVLKQTDLDAALKASKILDLPTITFKGNTDNIVMTVEDPENDSSHKWSRVVGNTDKAFSMIYRAELFKFLPGDYNVDVSSKKITRFTGGGSPVTYYVAANKNSYFNV